MAPITKLNRKGKGVPSKAVVKKTLADLARRLKAKSPPSSESENDLPEIPELGENGTAAAFFRGSSS